MCVPVVKSAVAGYSDVENMESDSPALSVSFLFLSGVMNSGAVKAARQGHWRRFLSATGSRLSELVMI